MVMQSKQARTILDSPFLFLYLDLYLSRSAGEYRFYRFHEAAQFSECMARLHRNRIL